MIDVLYLAGVHLLATAPFVTAVPKDPLLAELVSHSPRVIEADAIWRRKSLTHPEPGALISSRLRLVSVNRTPAYIFAKLVKIWTDMGSNPGWSRSFGPKNRSFVPARPDLIPHTDHSCGRIKFRTDLRGVQRCEAPSSH